MLANPMVKKALADLSDLRTPRTLASLPELFAKDGYSLGLKIK